MMFVDMSSSAYCLMTPWLCGCGLESVDEGLSMKLMLPGSSMHRCRTSGICSMIVCMVEQSVYEAECMNELNQGVEKLA